MTLEYCNQYKYLGYIINDKNNMEDHIKSLKGKVEAAYQAIITITGSRNFRNIEMKAIFELIETSIMAIINYSGEIWKPPKGETTEITRLMDNILRRVLMVPQSTPREALYIETGLLDPETISIKQSIMMDHRIKNGPSKRLNKLAQAEGEQS